MENYTPSVPEQPSKRDARSMKKAGQEQKHREGLRKKYSIHCVVYLHFYYTCLKKRNFEIWCKIICYISWLFFTP